MTSHRFTIALLSLFAYVAGLSAAYATETTDAPRAYRGDHLVQPGPDGLILAEAEEFKVDGADGWTAMPWGENYYAATFANTFLSRKAFLGAPATCDNAVASIDVNIPAAGNYFVLVRYEAAYRFETQFNVQVEQGGKQLFDRTYGARDNIKIWAFKTRPTPDAAPTNLRTEVAWHWGAVENIVWEGHDTRVQLKPGKATIKLIAGPQDGDAAKRNVDVVMLTTDEAEVQRQLAKAGRLPLDGLLTQAGDVYFKLHNRSAEPVKLVVPKCREHSPYWVHLRNWQNVNIDAAANASTDWVEVGSLLDTMNDGQWWLSAKGKALDYEVEVGLRAADGTIGRIATFASTIDKLNLVYEGDTRYSKLIRREESVLYDLLKAIGGPPAHGKKPEKAVIYCYTFDRKDDPQYNATIDKFVDLFGIAVGRTAVDQGSDDHPKGYIDVRGVSTPDLPAKMQELVDQGVAKRMHTVSLGDEIGLARPAGNASAAFAQWAQGKGLAAAEVDPASGGDWANVKYDVSNPIEPKEGQTPKRFYYSRMFQQDYGIAIQKERTAIIRKHLPNAGVGANFSPHHGDRYLGETYKWITLFREEGMTQPWSEDYIWQLPMGSQQMNFINLDQFRAAVRPHPEQKIHYYVMPHWPGNTPNQWRRQFYGDLAHGMKVINLFEFRPVQVAYTENHVTHVPMYKEILKSFYEFGLFEDIVVDGHVPHGNAAMWFSRVGDVWHDNSGSFAAGKRTLYIALLHQQLALDFVVDEDPLEGYELLVLTDRHVSRESSKKIAAWVKNGGTLLATAGAGMYDEFHQPNEIMQELLGVEVQSLDQPAESYVRYVKEDLPFAKPISDVTLKHGDADRSSPMPIFGARADIKLNSAEQLGVFKDGSPAVAGSPRGKGIVVYTAFLPGLTYFSTATPRRPVDRGSSDDAFAHFIPTAFHADIHTLMRMATRHVSIPVERSNPLVDARIVRSDKGVAIPLVNWTNKPVKNLKVTVNVDVPTGKASLASGGKVAMEKTDDGVVFTLDLDIADAIILR